MNVLVQSSSETDEKDIAGLKLITNLKARIFTIADIGRHAVPIAVQSFSLGGVQPAFSSHSRPCGLDLHWRYV